MTRHKFTSVALKELRQAGLYYEQREKGLGATFLDEIDATLTEFFRTLWPGTRCPHVRDAAELIAFHLV